MRNFNQTGVQMLRRFRPLPVVIVPARIEESDERLLEAVRQLRGESTTPGPGAETCLVTSAAGVPSSGLVLGRRR